MAERLISVEMRSYNAWMRAKPGQAIGLIEATVANPPDGCVLWPYAKTGRGYGVVGVDGKMVGAHRWALALATGGERPGLDAAHEPRICHEVSCINPRHLSWKTRSENHRDKLADETMVRGKDHPATVLSEADVRAIRADERSYTEIIRNYPVTKATITNIKQGVTWGHVPNADGSEFVGIEKPRRRFTDDDIALIRRSSLTSQELAKLFDVSYVAIWKIRTGRSYERVTG